MNRIAIKVMAAVTWMTATALGQAPITTSFTYQGRIKQAGNLVTGSCDFRFRLFDAAAGGNSVGPELIFDGNAGSGAPISVANGLFRAELDFGAGAFNGDRRWLEIRVRCPHGTPGDPNGYTTVSPRQEITASPYALSTRRPNALDAADGDPAEAVFVDVNGNVGLGTTAPSHSIHVQRPSVAHLRLSSDADQAGIILDSNNSGAASVYSPQFSDDLRFNLAGADRMAVTAAGRVGIGTTTPTRTLHVQGNVTIAPLVSDASLILMSDNAGEVNIYSPPASDDLRFLVGFADRMAIQSNGNVGIGTSTPSQRLHVNGGALVESLLVSGGSVGIGTTSPGFLLHVNGSAGKPGGGSWTDSSDIRLKTGVEPLDGALDRLLCLRGVTYEWVEPEKHGNLTGTQIGMIAQDVEEVFPKWVGTDNDGYKTLGFRGFEALTVEALRELKAEKDAEIAAQRGEIVAMKARIEALEKLVQRLARERSD